MPHEWKKIASLLNEKGQGMDQPIRTACQCRERWMNYIDRGLNKQRFTDDEDLNLLKVLLEIGNGRWHEITDTLNRRGDL